MTDQRIFLVASFQIDSVSETSEGLQAKLSNVVGSIRDSLPEDSRGTVSVTYDDHDMQVLDQLESRIAKAEVKLPDWWNTPGTTCWVVGGTKFTRSSIGWSTMYVRALYRDEEISSRMPNVLVSVDGKQVWNRADVEKI